MKSLFDLKHGIGKLIPQNPDDLWLLSSIIMPGSVVTAKTLRSPEIHRGDETVKADKRQYTLTIVVEKIELSDELRLGGKIIEGPPEIPHEWHTIEIAVGTELKVIKQWKKWELDKIKAAAKAAVPVLVCIIDEREVDFWIVKERPKHLTHLRAPSVRKEEKISEKVAQRNKTEFYDSVHTIVKRYSDMFIVLAGPGFERENFLKYIKERDRDLLKKIHTDAVSHTGEPGLNELLRRKTLEKFMAESRVTEETNLVEEFFDRLGKGGLCCYGRQVFDAAEAGAIETLLVADEKVRDYENVMELVEKSNGRVVIISTQHPAGEKLLGMDGIAALLRFRPEEVD